MYYNRARYYNPSSGRFIERDSVEGEATNPVSLNRYTYGWNNPVLLTDANGMKPGDPQCFPDNLTACKPLCDPNNLNSLVFCNPNFDTNPAGGRTGPLSCNGEWTFVGGLRICKISSSIIPLASTSTATGSSTTTVCDEEWLGKLLTLLLAWFAKSIPNINVRDKSPSMSVFKLGNDTKETTKHIIDAIASGRPSIVTYRGPILGRLPSGWLDNAKKAPECNPRNGLWCDEYPFATVEEGGELNKPSLRLVPGWEQRLQGGKWRAFLITACKVAAGERVKIEPSDQLPETTWTCKSRTGP